ncbi:hypothetical protein NX059_011446 [Plenodomus lindquistii]|nr:hypothetical protein NX059_011446 [Plenodomus lindquistii]
MSSSTKQRAALVHIITYEGDEYPRRPDGQYIPHNIVDGARRESLVSLFRKHKVLTVEPCLHPTEGEHIRNLYLATFPSERKMDAAIDAWDGVDLEDTPYIAQLSIEEIQHDLVGALPAGNDNSNRCTPKDAKPVLEVDLTTQNNFEDWWAAQGSENWAEHQMRLQHTAERKANGVWLYEDEVDTMPPTFTYAAYPIIEYNVLDQKEYCEPPFSTINWDATRDDERFDLGIPTIVQPEWLPIIAVNDAMSFSSGSGSEDTERDHSSPESSPPRTPTSDFLDMYGMGTVSLEQLKDTIFDMGPRGRNKDEDTRRLFDVVKEASLDNALQQLKGSPATPDTRSTLPQIPEIMDLSIIAAPFTKSLASSASLSLQN